MKPGSVILVRMPRTAEAPGKLRPALVLAELPGSYQDLLVCGVSTRLAELEADWDEVIKEDDPDFASSGLHRTSAVRLSFLASVESSAVAGRIGEIDASRLRRLLTHLAGHLSRGDRT